MDWPTLASALLGGLAGGLTGAALAAWLASRGKDEPADDAGGGD